MHANPLHHSTFLRRLPVVIRHHPNSSPSPLTYKWRVDQPLKRTIRIAGPHSGSLSYFECCGATRLFQKEIHAIEIDDGSMDIQCVHADDAGDPGAALLQCETRQGRDSKFFPRYLKAANVEIVEFRGADPGGSAAGELCRDPRRFRSEPERFNETLVQHRYKCAGIDQQPCLLSPD